MNITFSFIYEKSSNLNKRVIKGLCQHNDFQDENCICLESVLIYETVFDARKWGCLAKMSFSTLEKGLWLFMCLFESNDYVMTNNGMLVYDGSRKWSCKKWPNIIRQWMQWAFWVHKWIKVLSEFEYLNLTQVMKLYEP